MKKALRLTIAAFVLTAFNLSAATLYVSLQSTNPVVPYATWETAARVIQDAVDAAAPGDTVLVTNGVYATGGRPVGNNLLTNRVAIEKPIRLESVNGPAVTIIKGARAPAGDEHGNGDGAVRCVFLGLSNAILSGFTLTNGHTRMSGDWQSEQAGGGVWGGTWDKPGGVLTNCVITGNSANYSGGGAYVGTLNNCTLTGNSAQWGGGAYGGTLNNCTLTGNSASEGGGAYGGTLYNCTLTGNSADSGGGAFYGTLNNCIVYFNAAANGANYYQAEYYCILNYCCTTPLPVGGTGNIALDPQLASATHLSASSPCRGAGSAAYVSGTDIDGEPWATPPSIGCDEYHAGAMTGPLNVAIVAAFTNVATGYPVSFTALNSGPIVQSVWDFGDGTLATNQPFPAHAWSAPGIYTVRLTGYNESYPGGVSTTVTITVSEVVHYVDAASANPVFPYTSWPTAARTIQDAIGSFAAGTVPGAVVLVTNGVYRVGKVELYYETNRVALTNMVVVRSVNGPDQTIIEGETNGVRCAWVGNGAVLSGFTLTKGNSGSGGGVGCEPWAVVTNCTLTGNSASEGGGAYGGTLNNCTLTGNSASEGGGASGGTLHNCVLTGNSAHLGGGVAGAGYSYMTSPRTTALYNCVLTGNSAHQGGGVGVAGFLPGPNGASTVALYNCTLTGNWAHYGGGVAVVANSYRGSAYLNNCIVYLNRAPVDANYSAGSFAYSCTTPLPPGQGNIASDPLLVTASHLASNSPCIGAGSPAYASGVDIDGEPWANPPAMGADQPGSASGPLTLAIQANWTNVATGYPVSFVALNTGPILQSVWDFGDGSLATNQAASTHAWSVPGLYTVRLTGYNDSFPGGVSTTVTITVSDVVHYVDAASTNPVFPYTSWPTAARTIQDAIDSFAAGTVPGAVVLVTNGVYQVGKVEINGTNRVALTNIVVVRSANGPEQTIIEGETNGVRCAWVGNGAILSGFTLTKGNSESGGGTWCEPGAVVTNCVLTGNSALWMGGGAYSGTLYNCMLTANSAGYGGGASGGTLNNCALTSNLAFDGGGADYSTLNNCTLTGNSATNSGGGAFHGTLNNCTLTGNSAEYGGGAAWGTLNNCTLTSNLAYNGGGAYYGTLNNCIVYFNTAANGANYSQEEYNGILNYCCTTPLPTNGVGIITADPMFVNQAGGNFRLQSSSPCINAGLNAYVPGAMDLDGLPRIVSGTVDIGAYEFQGSGSTISYAWLQQYGLPTDGSADATDPDADGHNTWQEWRCQTDPTNTLSVLRLLSATPTGTNVTLSWQSVAGVNYSLERSTNLGASPPFTPLATGIPGQPGTTTYTDSNAAALAPLFYRVGVGQ